MTNEKRLIDANALDSVLEDFANSYRKDLFLLTAQAISDVRKIVYAMKDVDAVEVVHGHMVERIVDHECPWYKVYDCSECGCSVESWHNYCPNCGAKMDLKGE